MEDCTCNEVATLESIEILDFSKALTHLASAVDQLVTHQLRDREVQVSPPRRQQPLFSWDVGGGPDTTAYSLVFSAESPDYEKSKAQFQEIMDAIKLGQYLRPGVKVLAESIEEELRGGGDWQEIEARIIAKGQVARCVRHVRQDETERAS